MSGLGGSLGNGPAPKRPEDRARANKPPTAEITLPREGYAGEIPPWPLARKTAADAQLWATLWRTPQAAAWAPMGDGVHRELARYVVLTRGATADHRIAAEVRQLGDRFGMNPLSMRRLGWQVVGDDLADARGAEPRVRPVVVAD